MTFNRKVLVENSIKYVFILVTAIAFWRPIKNGLLLAIESGKLDSIGVIMGIVALCSVTGYFAFSYTLVGKEFVPRYFGYLSAYLLSVSLLLSLLIIFFITTQWVPEMAIVWFFILASLYLGAVIFDFHDLLRMGRDVAATSFYEKGFSSSADKTGVDATVEFLREGQRLRFANALIGKAISDIGTKLKDQALIDGGQWIIENHDKSQHKIDLKVVEIFSDLALKNRKVMELTSELQKKQEQAVADQLIATLLEVVNKV